jgi:Cytochrome c1
MMKALIALVLVIVPAVSWAAGEAVPLHAANIDLEDTASLQRGAKYFINYCLSCHSAAYMRYNRLARDLGLTERQVQDNLMFAAEKIGEALQVAMTPTQGKQWFGTPPPNLSLVARARGVDWLYTYLLSFYLDASRPFGVNNRVFKDVAMPHVLSELQGWQAPLYITVEKGGKVHKIIDGFKIVQAGTMKEEEYKQVVRDLVTFLAYIGEPTRLERERIGVWVIAFLVMFWVIAYLLKKEYWKSVH